MPRKRSSSAVEQAEATTTPQPQREQVFRTSLYLTPDEVVALDEMVTIEFKRQGRRLDRSELIRRAIMYYREHAIAS